MTLIAISYRFEDSVTARALHGQLVTLLGENNIFLSEVSISGGAPWERAIEKAFSEASLVVVLIGGLWATDADGNQRFGKDDYVLRELEAASQGECHVMVPILLEGVKPEDFTAETELPAAVRKVFEFQAIELDLQSCSLGVLCGGIAKKALRASIGIEAISEDFPLSQIAQALRKAKRRFLVWHTWTEYFDPYFRQSLKQFLQENFKDFGPRRCRILLAHPENSFTILRAEILAKASFGMLLKRCLGDIEKIARSIATQDLREVVEVRFYTTVPAMPLYMVDDKAFVGWYPPDERSHSSPYFEVVEGRGKLHRWLETTFDKSWDSAKWRWNFDLGVPEKIPPYSDGNRALEGM